jgi:predicted membrane channel-forming protein YqfA (hemolysin III family)
MFLRILLVLLKSSVMATMFEFLSPIADAMGLQLNLIARIAGAISHATTMPQRDSEIVVVFLLSATLLEISSVFWDLITTKASLIKLTTTSKWR